MHVVLEWLEKLIGVMVRCPQSFEHLEFFLTLLYSDIFLHDTIYTVHTAWMIYKGKASILSYKLTTVSINERTMQRWPHTILATSVVKDQLQPVLFYGEGLGSLAGFYQNLYLHTSYEKWNFSANTTIRMVKLQHNSLNKWQPPPVPSQ